MSGLHRLITRSSRFSFRTAATPNRLGTWIIPNPRISIWYRITPTGDPMTDPVLSTQRVVTSSETRQCPFLIRDSAVSLLPTPAFPTNKTPTPMISTMVPCMIMRGAMRFSMTIVAPLMKCLVINGVRRTHVLNFSASFNNSGKTRCRRVTTTHGT